MPENKKLRAAAYCRVSTEMELQDTSLKTQKEAFESDIAGNPDWEIVKIYSDRGLSGKNTEKRPGFRAMMEDVRAGKIDVILIKSISRAARNTVDLLKFIRELKELGVECYFCKEKLSSKSIESELVITVYAAFAQEEGRSLSENLKRGYRQKYSLGRPVWGGVMYGFKQDADGNHVVDEEVAPIIREIYRRVVEGDTLEQVAKWMNEEKIPTLKGADHGWRPSTLYRTVKNEKNIGDFLMQKTYIQDYISGKQISNKNAVLPQYYKENNHDPIVGREEYEIAGKAVDLRSMTGGSPQYPYYGTLRCPYCGEPMVRISAFFHGMPSVWICGGSGNKILQCERSNCKPFYAMEEYLNKAVLQAIDELEPENETVIWCQELCKRRGQVEYAVLYKLIDKITYTDCEHVKICWKNGKESIHELEPYRLPQHHPKPVFQEIEGKYFVSGIPVRAANASVIKLKLEELPLRYGATEIKKSKNGTIPSVRRNKTICGTFQTIPDDKELGKYVRDLTRVHKGTAQYPYYGILKCPFCGKPMIKINAYSASIGAVWFCGGSGESEYQRDRSHCPKFIIRERYITKALTDYINALDEAKYPDAAWAKETLKKSSRMEYIVIEKLFRKITFKGRWDIELTWKDGSITETRIESYDYPTHIPMPVLKYVNHIPEICGYPIPRDLATNFKTYHAKLEALCGATKITSVEGSKVPIVRRGPNNTPFTPLEVEE